MTYTACPLCMPCAEHCVQPVPGSPRDPSTAGCFGSSLIGVLLVTRAVRRSGKASALVLILAGVIGLGAVLTGAQRMIQLLQQQCGI